MIDYKKYWASDNLKNIAPQHHGQYPEGWDPAEVIKMMIKDENLEKVLDFGCGYGRLCQAFDCDSYLGVDLNPQAIEVARKTYPGYRFMEINIDSSFEKVDVVFAYTVFLHLDDDTLSNILLRLRESCQKLLIVAEILGREWRRQGLPPVFNRDLDDYQDLISSRGFKFIGEYRRPYQRYARMPEFRNKNTDISFLLYK